MILFPPSSGLFNLYGNASLPGAGQSFGAAFLAGVDFTVTQGGCYLAGYRYYCPAPPNPGPTTPQPFALWNVTGSSTGTLIPAGNVTSGTLTQGSWNTVLLATPVPLAIGTEYIAATGLTGNFCQFKNQFAAGQPFSAGITSGPLFAYSDTSGSAPSPYGQPQGVFNTSTADPTAAMPTTGSSSANFGVDVIITTTQPAAASTFQLWPSKFDSSAQTVSDSALNYIIGTEIHVLQSCHATAVRYFSPTGTAQLATRAALWSVGSQTELVANAAPSWSGAAASGWIQANFSSPFALTAGQKIVASVYNSAATPDQWSATDLSTAYWLNGYGKNGIQTGPLFAPPVSGASQCWEYNASLPGATPPYSNGTQAPGQCPFGEVPGGGYAYPQLYAFNQAQNYWVDLVVTVP